MNKNAIADGFRQLQVRICKDLEALDGKGAFVGEAWERAGGGGGYSRIIQDGNLIEKGGVNFSAVYGDLPENIQNALKVQSSAFFATGISIVLHPYNPFVPIIHMNLRYFELDGGTSWFGGGIDVTPHYVNEEESRAFHNSLKSLCDRYNSLYYSRFSTWADEYFFIRHRKETRGIGGIFFDRLEVNQRNLEFVQSVGDFFVPAYSFFVQANRNRQYDEQNKHWQYIRRGRYVEFNLVYDKGTKFGLDTNGRIESILMSLPPMAAWPYDFKPAPGSEEEKTLQFLMRDNEK